MCLRATPNVRRDLCCSPAPRLACAVGAPSCELRPTGGHPRTATTTADGSGRSIAILHRTLIVGWGIVGRTDRLLRLLCDGGRDSVETALEFLQLGLLRAEGAAQLFHIVLQLHQQGFDRDDARF